MVPIAWSSPPTFTTGQTITAAFLNALRDNLNETAPAKATASGWPGHFVSNGVNSIAERRIENAYVDANENTTSNTYTNLTTTGPSVTLITGAHALVFLSVQVTNGTAAKWASAAWQSPVHAADDDNSVQSSPGAVDEPYRGGITALASGLTPGSNLFTTKYRCESASTGKFQRRHLVVMAL